LPDASKVKLKVYNILGEVVTDIANDFLPAGTHTFQFDGEAFSSGFYLVILEALSTVKSQKILLLK
jgi:hypothetical protein